MSSGVDAFEIYFTLLEKVLAELLPESDEIVMVRENPNQPFHFALVETLRSKPPIQPINAFLNSRDRPLLAVY
jgi:hypothetical protein